MLLGIYASYPVLSAMGKEIIFTENSKQLFSIVYFFIFIDLSISITKFMFEKSKSDITFLKRVIIFFCLLVPPIGIYYLSVLYKRK
jgi:hypothetical protein